VRLVRDKAIEACDTRLHPAAASPVSKRWKAAIAEHSAQAITDVVVADCIDEAIFNLLFAIDDGSLKLSFQASNGVMVDLTQEGLGELGGWYVGSGGWRAMYSEQRVNDYMADLAGKTQ
jgi:hypothetical protein